MIRIAVFSMIAFGATAAVSAHDARLARHGADRCRAGGVELRPTAGLHSAESSDAPSHTATGRGWSLLALIALQDNRETQSTKDNPLQDEAKNPPEAPDDLSEELRLPRPNLGPEPAPAAPSVARKLTLVLLAMAWLVVVAWRVWRPQGTYDSVTSVQAPAAPRAYQSPIAIWAEAVREKLVRRYGPSWAAKTTEELASRPELAEQFTPEHALQIIAFLRAADRAKFAEVTDEPDQRDAWEGWVTDFLASSDEDAMSRINGR